LNSSQALNEKISAWTLCHTWINDLCSLSCFWQFRLLCWNQLLINISLCGVSSKMWEKILLDRPNFFISTYFMLGLVWTKYISDLTIISEIDGTLSWSSNCMLRRMKRIIKTLYRAYVSFTISPRLWAYSFISQNCSTCSRTKRSIIVEMLSLSSFNLAENMLSKICIRLWVTFFIFVYQRIDLRIDINIILHQLTYKFVFINLSFLILS
jgi:hypothetical protein